nr:MAG TPA: hypothetical protein [Caudoviricetes sp.]
MLADMLLCKSHGFLCLTASSMLSACDRRLEGVLRGSRAIDAIWYGCYACALFGCIDG